ncbi:MAG: 5'/3'-nucleotidase SurE [Planctomycetes bacterium]|nr:5'/3'-nucleotidase SurE [Planctomycetota bacterium]
MLILVTNDDGVRAPGLWALVREIRRLGDVVVAAPSAQKSAISSSITIYTPLLAARRREEGCDVHSVDGTTADAVKLAFCELLPERPQLVVSGINFGLNTGSNVLYSGTVAGALEAALYSVPAFAVSLEATDDPQWSVAARMARTIVQKLLRRHSKEPVAFNVNIPARPASRIRGTLATVTEPEPHADSYERRQDPRGRTYYWLRGTPARRDDAESNGAPETPTDAWAVAHGYVSVTPIRRDLTDHGALKEAKKLLT